MREFRKIAVVGTDLEDISSTGDDGLRTTVESFSWKRLNEFTSPSEYDELIIDLTPLDDELQDSNAVWDLFSHILNTAAVLSVLFPGGNIYVVGDASITVRVARGDVPFLGFLGLECAWIHEPGDGVKEVSDNHSYLAPYLKLIRKYEASLVSCVSVKGDPVYFDELVKTRSGSSIATMVRIPDFDRGAIYLLPTIETSEKSMDVLLNDVLRVGTPENPPDWLSAISAPGHAPIAKAKEDKMKEILRLHGEFDSLLAEEREIQKPLRLLFESGEYFEAAVLKAFEAIGAEVREPVNKGHEDGWISYQGKEFVLEAKTTEKETFNKKGIRQLSEWVQNGREDDKEYKGLWVGINQRLDPLEARGCAYPDDVEKFGRRNNFVLLDGVDLYKIYERHHQGELDVDAFFEALNKTAGVFDAKPFL